MFSDNSYRMEWPKRKKQFDCSSSLALSYFDFTLCIFKSLPAGMQHPRVPLSAVMGAAFHQFVVYIREMPVRLKEREMTITHTLSPASPSFRLRFVITHLLATMHETSHTDEKCGSRFSVDQYMLYSSQQSFIELLAVQLLRRKLGIERESEIEMH